MCLDVKTAEATCRPRGYEKLSQLKFLRKAGRTLTLVWNGLKKQGKEIGFNYFLWLGGGARVEWEFMCARRRLGFPCGSAGKGSTCNVGDWVWSPGWQDPLEKVKSTHSSILTWRLPWTVYSMGSQRVGHDWVTFTHSQKQIRWYEFPTSTNGEKVQTVLLVVPSVGTSEEPWVRLDNCQQSIIQKWGQTPFYHLKLHSQGLEIRVWMWGCGCMVFNLPQWVMLHKHGILVTI